MKSNFFTHDFFARTDPKLMQVHMAMGMHGIGIYWCLIEMLYEESGYLSLANINSIAFLLHVESVDISSLINDFDLFQHDEERFWSVSVLARIDERTEIAEKRSNAGKKAIAARWERVRTEAKREVIEEQTKDNVIPNEYESYNDGNTIDKQENKIKENKIKDIIEEDKSSLSVSTKPTIICDIDFKAFVEFWNTTIQGSLIKPISRLGEKRKHAIAARVKEYGKDAIAEMLKKAVQSSWLGESGKGNIDWMMKPNNFPKVLEGNYDNRGKVAPKHDSSAEREAERTRRERAYDENAALSITPSQYKALLARAKQGDTDALHALQLTPEQVANLAN